MDARVDPPSMAMALISEGKQQLIEVESKDMLRMVVQALGAKEMPVFTENDSGSLGITFSVKLDVSCAHKKDLATVKTVVIQGEPSQTKEVAQKSAALNAIKHLVEKRHIEIIDYSSRVVGGFEGSQAGSHVNAVMFSLDKLVAQWEITMNKCKELTIEAAAKIPGCLVANDCELWGMYDNHKGFFERLILQFSSKLTDARSKATDLDFIRKQYNQMTNEKNLAKLRKGYWQTAIVQPKVIMDYVLEYLGTCKARYSNRPSDGLLKGVVKFYIPRLLNIKCCGNIEIEGIGRSSSEAEEDAVLQALLFIEANYKIKIKDLNYTERMCAENAHNKLVDLLEQMLCVAGEVKQNWGRMIKIINKEHKQCGGDKEIVYTGEAAIKRQEAYIYCAEKMQEFAQDSTQRYEACSERFQEMIALECKLGELRTELELD